MSLPTIAQLEFDDESPSISDTVHNTFAWDFETGDFKLQDGKLIELTGIEYLKVWIAKTLHTVINTLIYKGTDYGSEHHSLIGRNFNPLFAKSEYERMIREALKQNEAITNVDKFSFTQSGSRLIISFNVQSIYGETDGQVMV